MGPERRVQRMEEVLRHRLARVCVAIEALYHRHNVSAILRTCDAVGVHDVHVVGDLAVSRGPARGAERWLNIVRHPTAEAALERISADGFAVWVADLVGEPRTPEEVPVDRPVCLWFGAELVGVAPAARARAQGVVTVPMRGMAQSLNVSVAAALVLRPVAERARQGGAPALLDPRVRAEILARWIERDRDPGGSAGSHGTGDPIGEDPV